MNEIPRGWRLVKHPTLSEIDFESRTIYFTNSETLSHELAHLKLGPEPPGFLEGEFRAIVYATAKGWATNLDEHIREDLPFTSSSELRTALTGIARDLRREGRIGDMEFNRFVGVLTEELRNVE